MLYDIIQLMTFDQADTMFINPEDVIIISWVDKYHVNWYQKSPSLLNDLLMLKEVRSIFGYLTDMRH